MRSMIRTLFVIVAVTLSLAFGLNHLYAHAGVAGVAAGFLLINSVAFQLTNPNPLVLGTATLTTSEVLLQVIRSFRQQIPGINRMGTDFRGQALKLNQTYIAHIPGMPTVQNYDAGNGGYKNGAQSARALLTDVQITVSAHKHVPLKWAHLDNIKDNKRAYDEVIGNAGYVLAKAVVDDLLSGVNARNFSEYSVYSAANSDLDMVTAITGKMNKKAALAGRTMFVNTDVANVLGADSRIASRDYLGQQTQGNPYRRWNNVGGFAEIAEYPDFPLNNGSQVTGVAAEADDEVFTKVAHGFENLDPVTFVSGTGFTGIVAGTKYFARDVTADTFKLSATPGGAAINITLDGSAGVFQLAEDLSGFAFDMRAFGLLAGIPEDFNSALAAQLGIPQVMGFEAVTDPETQITMAAVSWQDAGTGDLYWSPTLVWGKSLGKQGSANAAGTKADYAGHRLALV